jgi:hypothetical protein
MKAAQIVIYFLLSSEKSLNNQSQIVPAIVNRVWSEQTLNLTLLPDGGLPLSRTSAHRATNADDAISGGKWATVEEVEAWGIDLSSGYAIDEYQKRLADVADQPVNVEPTTEEAKELDEENS